VKILTQLMVVVLVVLLIASAAQAAPGQTQPTPPAGMTGGGYRLTTISPQSLASANAIQSGGQYMLAINAVATDPAPGCCCRNYLSCVTKN
jgi:hypothetical protein